MMRVPLVVEQRLHVPVGRYIETLVPKQFLHDLRVIPVRSQERAIRVSQSVERTRKAPMHILALSEPAERMDKPYKADDSCHREATFFTKKHSR
jgi:hypothetical protein